MYSVHQHWDRLKSTIVGKSYPPEFYSFIKNPKLRNLFEKIAIETEEDYQNLIKVLKSFDVDIVRPNCPDIAPENYFENNLRIPGPVSMNPRDQVIMIGDKFFIFPYNYVARKTSGKAMKDSSIDYNLTHKNFCNWWQPVIDKVAAAGNQIINYSDGDPDIEKFLGDVAVNGIVRCGYDLYFGRKEVVTYDKKVHLASKWLVKKYFQNYRPHYINSGGHVDGVFTPVKPGLIISYFGMDSYDKTFPNWEVVQIPQSDDKNYNFASAKRSKNGSWLIVNTNTDSELVDFVDKYLRGWTGNIVETNFDVNSLVIDESNILVTQYNKVAFEAYERHGVTPHIVPLRHQFFWDGGLSCITGELHREGKLKNIFPERGEIV